VGANCCWARTDWLESPDTQSWTLEAHHAAVEMPGASKPWQRGLGLLVMPRS
jgi:hypothetical protein